MGAGPSACWTPARQPGRIGPGAGPERGLGLRFGSVTQGYAKSVRQLETLRIDDPFARFPLPARAPAPVAYRVAGAQVR